MTFFLILAIGIGIYVQNCQTNGLQNTLECNQVTYLLEILAGTLLY